MPLVSTLLPDNTPGTTIFTSHDTCYVAVENVVFVSGRKWQTQVKCWLLSWPVFSGLQQQESFRVTSPGCWQSWHDLAWLFKFRNKGARMGDSRPFYDHTCIFLPRADRYLSENTDFLPATNTIQNQQWQYSGGSFVHWPVIGLVTNCCCLVCHHWYCDAYHFVSMGMFADKPRNTIRVESKIRTPSHQILSQLREATMHNE